MGTGTSESSVPLQNSVRSFKMSKVSDSFKEVYAELGTPEEQMKSLGTLDEK